MSRRITRLGILGVIASLAALSQPVLADGTSFAFRAGSAGGAGRSAPTPAPTSNPQQFFGQFASQQQFYGQATNRQQQFFAQPVFPHSNFDQNNPMPGQAAFVPPSIRLQSYALTSLGSSYLPQGLVSGDQPGFYLRTTFSSSGIPIVTEYATPQQANGGYGGNGYAGNGSSGSNYGSTPQPRVPVGLLGRW